MVTITNTFEDTKSIFDEGERYWVNFYGFNSFTENKKSRALVQDYKRVTILWMNRETTRGNNLTMINVDELTEDEYKLAYQKATLW